jgi:hypothetical protein
MQNAWGRGVYEVLAGTPEAKSPLGRPNYKWRNNIRMVLKETG